jgi:cytochrome c556
MRLIEVSTAAYEATEARDLDAIVALSPELEQSCRDCHEQYHPRFGRRRPGAEGENP